jgi:thiamine biosynthesis lipoprotein
MSLEVEHSFPAMGSRFYLRCYPQNHLSKEDCLDLFHGAESEVNRIENLLTEFKESPFNEINKNAGQQPVVVCDEIFQLINKCQKLSEETQGLFDITSSTLIYHHKIAQRKKIKLKGEEVKKLKALVNYKTIELNNEKQTVFLPNINQRIGLGGIGKGYAVDRVYELLKSSGMYNFYINGSGDIRVHSHSEAPRKWRIGLQNPFNTKNIIGLIQIAMGAVATSGSYKQQGHIFSKKHQELVSTTVLADTAEQADTLGTVLMNMKKESAITLLDEKNLAGIVIDREGKSYLSKKALDQFGK